MAVTKKKTAPFKGAWMNPSIPEPLVRDTIVAHCGLPEDGGLAEECVGRVLAVLRDQRAAWRFEQERRDADPEPGQWNGILRAIVIPERMDWRAFDDARRKVNALPARVLGVLNAVLFDRAEVWTIALFERMRDATATRDGVADPADVALLRDALADMIEGVTYIQGKLGPQADIGTPFRAVLAELPDADTLPVTKARELAAALLDVVGINTKGKRAPRGRTRLAELAKGRD